MYKVINASKDAYITNKIIGSSLRATDSNSGGASSLDLFKLYDENTIGGESTPIELSKILIYFDLNSLRSLTGSYLDLNSSTFSARLKLHDIYGGQTCPDNFRLAVYPLSKSFDEGIGRDVIQFRDVDVCNFLTASVSSGIADVWNRPGAEASGTCGNPSIDIIEKADLRDGGGTRFVYTEQLFSKGTEDLDVDVTDIISGTLAGNLPDCGFLISYSGTMETDSQTRFVKRFASRNTTSVDKRPKLIVKYDDSVVDYTRDFIFNVSGSIFLTNYERGIPANIVSGANASRLSGVDCGKLKIISGSYQQIVNFSQHKKGSDFFTTGLYSASFAISSFDQSLFGYLKNTTSASFSVVWASNDLTVGFLTGSLIVNKSETSFSDLDPRRVFINITNMKSTYLSSETIRFKVFIEDLAKPIKAEKLPRENTGIFIEQVYYRVRDIESSKVLIPFDTSGTRVSMDATTGFFDIDMSSLPVGRNYTFDFQIVKNGSTQTINNVAASFRVVE
jgi:hypothetical protein